MTRKKILTAGLILLTLALILGLLSCNHGRPCVQTGVLLDIMNRGLIGEPYGATDINAVSGNQGLTMAENAAGTITVLKWPNPSYYDQVKYMTTTRGRERLGALANEGVLSGLYYETANGPGFFWLRDEPAEQSYLSERSAAAVTRFRADRLGLSIEQSDFVDPAADVLWRHYRIVRSPGSPVTRARLLAYANLSPQVSKIQYLPIQDWCLDETGSSNLRWREADDLFIQSKTGRDFSTQRPAAVYLALGFERKSSGHQAGYDAIASCARDPRKRDAFVLAATGALPGSDRARGRVTAGLIQELSFDAAGAAPASFLIGAAGDEDTAAGLIVAGRKKGFELTLAEAEAAWEKIFARAPAPAGPPRVRELARRSVMVMWMGLARESGAGVASISTQPPYGLDWSRDGSYINEALLAAGFPDLVRKRCLFWARVQSQSGNRLPFVPPGNWASNYYADGVPGFPILWWEIDETGWALWSIARSYQADPDRAYLVAVYPAAARAADFLAAFRDPATGLPRPAREDDNPRKSQSLHGAVPVALGLKSAAALASAMGDEAARAKWSQSYDELVAAIITRFYDPVCGRFVGAEADKGRCEIASGGNDPALLIWPSEILAPGDPRAEQAAEQVWRQLEPSFNGGRARGLYEPWPLLILARFWKDRPDKLERARRGLLWEASVPVTNTGLFGEIWFTQDGRIIPGQGQPQLWHHALFYLAALTAFGAE